MSKKLLIIATIIVVIIGAAATYLVFNKPSMSEVTPQTSGPTTEQTPSAEPPQTTPPAPVPGSYKDYTATSIADTKGTKVLFFHAPWCPQCRELEASIKAGTIPDSVTIFKVDYDTNQTLRQKYGVTLQTTLVLVDDAGNLVKKFVAYNEPSLTAVIRNLLQ